ncbi:unnamed protein product [Didymodactylos carnosus]|uniref:FHA domain-containing protein n=1 Tax=Didymodactylos carnosus TaxID=1234261 RepID=A0A813NQ64_9BILA|nr:unnamed protein product [Didymodactylos carnosus]CAF3519842.1 unnamed protein product [Didymodactylos carnosus]
MTDRDQPYEIILLSQSVDPNHVRIHTDRENRNMKIKDLSAMNGTFVNNGRTESQREIDLKHNDKMSINSDPTILIVKKQDANDVSLKGQSAQSKMLHSPFGFDAPSCEQRQSNGFLIERMLNDENIDRQNSLSNPTSYNTVISNFQPSIDYNEDASSDAGTYIIDIEHRDFDVEDNDDNEQIEPQQQYQQHLESPLAFKRYTSSKRHGTYNLNGIQSSPRETTPPMLPAMSTVYARPVVIPDRDLTESLSSSSSSSSLSKIRLEPEGNDQTTTQESVTERAMVYARQRPQALITDPDSSNVKAKSNTNCSFIASQIIKPAECFVISPIIERKTIINANEKNLNITRKNNRLHPAGAANMLVNYSSKVKSAPLSSSTLNDTTTIHQKELDNNSIANDINSLPSTTATFSPVTTKDDTENYFARSQQLTTSSVVASSSSDEFQMQNIRTLPLVEKSLQNADMLSKLFAAIPFSHSPRQHVIDQQTFQRNAPIRQTIPSYSRESSSKIPDLMSSSLIGELPSSHTSSRSNSIADDITSHPSLSKVSVNKSFALRRQRSSVSTTNKVQQQTQSQPLSITKPVQRPTFTKSQIPPAQIYKPTDCTYLDRQSSINSQTNRAVELRKARARAKIDELSQRTKQQQQQSQEQQTMTNQQLMTASLYNGKTNLGSSKRKDIRSTYRPTTKQSLDVPTHRSSSASPNTSNDDWITTPTRTNQQQQPTKYRLSKPLEKSLSIDEHYTSKMETLVNETEPQERCEVLRDDGQRLVIKLIQLSSGILEKLKINEDGTDDDTNVKELEKVIDKLQAVNKTLSTIDAVLSMSTNNDPLFLPTSWSQMTPKQNYRSSTNFE